MQRGQPPSFYELDEYTFQRLCNDLLAAEPEVMSSSEYGIRGQDQYGIDLLALRYEGLAYDVAQCKCYKTFRPDQITAASDEFLAHWTHWSTRSITHFILIVAGDMSSRPCRDAIVAQRERFIQYGIQYLVWDATDIRNKLAPHRDIVERHLGPEWVSIICGSEWISRTQTTPIPAASLANSMGVTAGGSGAVTSLYLDLIAATLSNELRDELSTRREMYREGSKQEVYRWLTSLRANTTRWTILENDVKAALLRFAAAVELDLRHDPKVATALLDEAQLLEPGGNDRRIRALITERTDGLTSALSLIADASDTDSLNLRASLLLRHGDFSESRQVIERLQHQRQADAESVRLLALIHLAQNELDQAQLAIQKAREIAPQWLSIRWTAALVDYYSALTIAAVGKTLDSWPQPVEWALIKRDDASLARLRSAAEVFRDLAALPDPPDDRADLRTWYLACLANDLERQSEAVNVCTRMLQDNPTDYRATTWAVSRSFPIDLQPVERALNRCITSKNAKAAHVQALAGCYLATNRARKARQLLERTRALFQAAGVDDAWTAWHIHAIAVQGKRSEISELLAQQPVTPGEQIAYASALHRHAEQTRSWEALAAYCDRRYAESADPVWLLQACEALAQGKLWNQLADRAASLIAAIPTAQAVHLAVVALHQAGHYDQCLMLLERQQIRFPYGRLPHELRRIRIACQTALGILSGAVAEAEALFRDEPSPTHYLALIQAYIDTGDLHKLALAARNLSYASDLPAQALLRVAQLVMLVERELAVSLWRRIVAHPDRLPDELVGSVMGLGFQLGCEDELRGLMGRMQVLAQAGRGGMQQLDLHEAIEMLQQQRRNQEEFNEMYYQGAVPNHMIADLKRWPLVALYHTELVANAETPAPLRQFPLLARHGSRPLSTDVRVEGQPRLHLDVTALLITAHLDLLDAVEQAFGPLFIPMDLIAALIMMRSTVADQQFSQIQAAHQILSMVDQQLVHILDAEGSDAHLRLPALGVAWNKLFERTRQLDGILVDYLPKRDMDELDTVISLPDEVANYVCNPRTLIEALRLQGPYSDDDYNQARNRLGTEGQAPATIPVPRLGVTIVLAGNVPATLASAEILTDIAHHFQVWIEEDELARARATVRNNIERQKLQSWLSQVLERVRQGVEDGRYQVVPLPTTAIAQEGDVTFTVNDRCLFTLLLYPVQPNDIIWIDDRHATGLAYRDGIPIVGISDVLHWLRTRGIISRATYFDKLLALRAANVRYLPLDCEEIVYHLSGARIEEERVLETHALQVIRRYLAACLAQGEYLQRPVPNAQGSMSSGELPFVLINRRVVLEAMRCAWSAADDVNTSRVLTEWVYAQLYVESLSVREFMAGVESPEEQRYFQSLDLTELLISAMPSHSESDSNEMAEQTYYRWIVDYIVEPRCLSDPLMPVAIAERVKPLLTDFIDEHGSTLEQVDARIGAQLMYRVLPSVVQVELQKDAVFMARLGYHLTLTVGAGQNVFERRAFLRAVIEAINGRPALLVPHNADLDLHIRARKAQEPLDVVMIEDADTGYVLARLGPEFQLAQESVSEREAVLRRHQYWFERPSMDVDRLIAHIAALDDPEQRMAEVDTWLVRSVTVFFSMLLGELRSGQEISADSLMPPHIEELLWYLRLDPTAIGQEPFAELLETAAQTLIRDIGLGSAIERLVGLPIPLPVVIVNATLALAPSEQRLLLKRLLRAAGSPVSQLHFVRLALAVSNASQGFSRLVHRMVRAWAHPAGLEAFHTFLILLRWVATRLGRRAEVRAWVPTKRLAVVWTHAHHLYATFQTARIGDTQLRSWFNLDEEPISAELFDRNVQYWDNNAHPGRVHPLTLLLDGLAYALSDHASEICSPTIKAQLTALAFPLVDGQPMPNLQLIELPADSNAIFASFLGPDRGIVWQPLLDEDAAANLVRASLLDQLEDACQRLGERQDHALDWLIVQAVLHDRVPGPTVVEALAAAIRQTDFANLISGDVTAGLFAVRAAVEQARHLPTDVHQHIRDAVVSIARWFGTQAGGHVQMPALSNEEQQAQSDLRLAVVGFVQTLALTDHTGVEAVHEFVALMTEIIAVWPQIASWCQPIIQRFWEELPVDQGHQLWPLVVRLRAA